MRPSAIERRQFGDEASCATGWGWGSRFPPAGSWLSHLSIRVLSVPFRTKIDCLMISVEQKI